MSPEAELEVLDFVFLGSFHPGLLQPSWLARQGLIPEAEADNAKVKVITNDVTQFELDWCAVEVLENRLRVATQLRAYYLSLRDLAFGIVRCMPSITVTACGLNHSAHFRVPENAQWEAIGHAVLPKTFWSEIIDEPRTRLVQVETHTPDDKLGKITLTLQPSTLFSMTLNLSANYHHELRNSGSDNGVETAARSLAEGTEASIAHSELYFRKTIELITSLGEK